MNHQIDNSLSPEQIRIRDIAHDFSKNEIAPQAAENNRKGQFPHELLRRAGELGLLGLLIPKEFGGSDLGGLALMLVLEEVNKACAATGVTISVHSSLCSVAIRRYGSKSLQQQFLPRMATGEILGSYCLTEPQSGSDAAALATSAQKIGEDYVLNGTKLFVTTGAQAGVYVVFARTDVTSKTGGITAFVIDRQAKGLRIGKHEVKMGLSASHTVEVLLEDCSVSASQVLGVEGQGFKIAMSLLDGGRIGIAAQSLGIAQACLDAAAHFALNETINHESLALRQSIRHKLADMATDIEAARHLIYNAARRYDAGVSCTREASMAKLFASRICNHVARDSLRIHGAYGTLKNRDVERFFRDARATELYEGTTEIQKLVISRLVLEEYRA